MHIANKPAQALIGAMSLVLAPIAHSVEIIPIPSFDPDTFFADGITAGIDFDVPNNQDPPAFDTQPGFLSLPATADKEYNVTHNGITFDIVTRNNNLANQQRNRNNANAGPLMTDFQQFFGDTEGSPVEATVTLTGLLPNTFYEVAFFTANVGAGQTTHSFYDGASTDDPLITTFSTSGNQNNYGAWSPGIIFLISSGSNAEISVTIQGTQADTSPFNSRLTFDGMSVKEIGPAPSESFQLTITPNGDAFDFSWPSQEDKVYDLLTSTDLADSISEWPIYHDGETLYEAIPSGGDTTTLTAVPSPDPRRFFAVRGYDAPPPPIESELSSLWGSGDTVTLSFTEPLDETTATNTRNYNVFRGDMLWVISTAALSPDGRTVTLTLGTPLTANATFSVAISNVTSIDGVPLPPGITPEFQTWDNDPDGIKVFILAGQSNMVGFGHVETGHDGVEGAIGSLRHLAVNNESFPEYDYTSLLVDPAEPETSPWRTRDDVQVWWRDGGANLGGNVRKGPTGPPFHGTSRDSGPNLFGPEFGFGHVIGDFHADDDVLLIKIAWGGKSLAVDFRPPSAVAARGGEVGEFYHAIFDDSRDVLNHLGDEFPQWEGRGYQIAGFGWHQGWNDRVNQGFNDEYEENMVDFIADVRTELGLPELPFVIASTGIDGVDMSHPRALSLMAAQLAMADFDKYPQHEGNVEVIDTRGFWRPADESPAGPNQGFHWHQNAETFFLIGSSMGERMADLLEPAE